MTARRRQSLVSALAVAVLFGVGLVAAGYVLFHERLPVPFRATYEITAQLTAADGVVPGLGQPVEVAGVQVGSIVGARVADGLAQLTLQIDRSELPHVYGNADVTLQPVTPLGDVQIALSPGGPPAAALAPGATIVVAQTTSPVALEQLLSSLDGETRSWLGSLMASLGQGLGGRGPDLRRMLVALGPNAEQVRRLAVALAVRRHDLAHLVHDLAVVTRAASSDRRLAPLVLASDQTMRALASQSGPLSEAVRLLPGSLGHLDTTLVHLRGFAGQLGPALRSLMPAIGRLPTALAALRPFAAAATGVTRSQLTPLVRAAAPLVRTLDPAVQGLAAATPFLTSSLQVLTYVDDELAYNPGGANQGYLYWMDWFFHNWDSVFSSGDANGISPRANVLGNCNALAAAGKVGGVLESVLGLGKLC